MQGVISGQQQHMSNDITNKMLAFKAEVEQKINNLLAEFAEGKLNREQFHVIYERYNGQIELAEKALNGGDVMLNEQDGGTIVLREKYMGKARGLMIMVNTSGNVIETLGNFNVAMSEILPIIARFAEQVREGHTIERVVRQINGKEWLLFVAGTYTTIVTVFEQEPSRYQTQVLQRMHKEFEAGNTALFTQNIFDPEQLVYPFRAFVSKSIGK